MLVDINTKYNVGDTVIYFESGYRGSIRKGKIINVEVTVESDEKGKFQQVSKYGFRNISYKIQYDPFSSTGYSYAVKEKHILEISDEDIKFIDEIEKKRMKMVNELDKLKDKLSDFSEHPNKYNKEDILNQIEKMEGF